MVVPAERFPCRSDVQCLHRWQKVLNPALVKGGWSKEVRLSWTASKANLFSVGYVRPQCLTAWSVQEDAKIIELVGCYGARQWSRIASELPGRIGKQCRER